MLIYGILLILLSSGVFIASGKLWVSWQTAMETRQQIDMMQQYIADWAEKAQRINQEPYRAIKAEQIDSVQSNLILTLQAHNLEMDSFKNMISTNEKAAKSANGKNFEMSFRGSWGDTVRFLERFHVNDALLSICNLTIQPDKDGSAKTSLQYKIYTK